MYNKSFYQDYKIFQPTISEEIIAFLFSCGSKTIQRNILYEFVKNKRKVSRDIIYNNLYRLGKNGLVNNNKNELILSSKGRIYHKNPYKKVEEKLIKKNRVLVIFDIPESKKKIRNWLRNQLRDWNFEMIQKSVWMGYGPLPKEFEQRIKNFGISDGFRVFNIRKAEK